MGELEGDTLTYITIEDRLGFVSQVRVEGKYVVVPKFGFLAMPTVFHG
jgi:hypothetical protein